MKLAKINSGFSWSVSAGGSPEIINISLMFEGRSVGQVNVDIDNASEEYMLERSTAVWNEYVEKQRRIENAKSFYGTYNNNGEKIVANVTPDPSEPEPEPEVP